MSRKVDIETLVDLGLGEPIPLGTAGGIDLGLGELVDLGLDSGADEPQEPALMPDGSLRVEHEALAELNEAQQRFKGIFKQQRDSFVNATDSVYWACLCFQSRAQLVEFLAKAGLMNEIDGQYIDGRTVAKKMGITLETPALPARKPRKLGKMLDIVSEA